MLEDRENYRVRRTRYCCSRLSRINFVIILSILMGLIETAAGVLFILSFHNDTENNFVTHEHTPLFLGLSGSLTALGAVTEATLKPSPIRLILTLFFHFFAGIGYGGFAQSIRETPDLITIMALVVALCSNALGFSTQLMKSPDSRPMGCWPLLTCGSITELTHRETTLPISRPPNPARETEDPDANTERELLLHDTTDALTSTSSLTLAVSVGR